VYRLHVEDMSCLRIGFFPGSSLSTFKSKFKGLCYLGIRNTRGHPIIDLIILCVCLCWNAICLYRVLCFFVVWEMRAPKCSISM
jgi:hypothetical protein